MRNKTWSIIILLGFLMGCSAQRQSATLVKQDRKFFTPANWQDPISESTPIQSTVTSSAISTPAAVTADSAVAATNNKFKPNFSGLIVSKSTSTPPKTTSVNDGFQPKFANANIQSQKPASATSISKESREQMDGYASWYGPGFHGKQTANGEKYNQNQMTAAHRILPMNTWVQVTNLANNRVAVVRINDRGPYKKNRIIDLTRKAAETLQFKDKGTAQVSLKILQYPKNFDPSRGLDPYKQVVVQIAVFKGEKRAHDFQKQLSQRYEHIPFLIDDHKTKAFHVIAGPYEERRQAIKIAKALKAEGIDNFVRSYRK
ncbi:MAG: septal ring lytic transglycosylase RlpA family protein [SAR324 cluster bacterium]|nr:septal ring lytic transglycosylase RlpA family protein [SAR324 cluster bacterium]